MKVDFNNDFRLFVISFLQDEGCMVDIDSDLRKLAYQLCTYLEHKIRPTPRSIFVSNVFNPPSETEHLQGLKNLETDLGMGNDITKYLHKPLLKTNEKDGLLSHWGIHHFHLGHCPDEKDPRFVKRTGPLLLARVTEDSAYFIGVYSHNELSERCWAISELIEILHRNWPESISNYKMKGNVSGDRLPDDKLAAIWKNRGNVIWKTEDGTAYGMLGGGVNCAGGSKKALRNADGMIEKIFAMERHIISKENDILAQIGNLNRRSSDTEISINLHFEEGTIFALERTTGWRWELGRFC